MISRQERHLILKHALATEDNLAIALKIGSSFDEIRSRIISDFAAGLEGQLRTVLGQSWSVVNDFPRDTALVTWQA